ncbi:MAG: DUF6526 family protein [Acidobacteriota bacterium]
MAEQEQNIGNHSKWVPGYHFVLFGILVLNLVWRVLYAWRLYGRYGHTFELNALADIGVAVALVLISWYLRTFPLKVQDRVIRVEERERLARLLPPDLRGRVGEFSAGQLIGLRFASDEELPALAQKVLQDKITDRKTIKQLVRNWRADHLRA